jgi:hypothetical protein
MICFARQRVRYLRRRPSVHRMLTYKPTSCSSCDQSTGDAIKYALQSHQPVEVAAATKIERFLSHNFGHPPVTSRLHGAVAAGCTGIARPTHHDHPEPCRKDIETFPYVLADLERLGLFFLRRLGSSLSQPAKAHISMQDCSVWDRSARTRSDLLPQNSSRVG